MTRRKHISSLDVARESALRDGVVVEHDRNRTKRVRAKWRANIGAQGRREDNLYYMVTYGARGVEFTVSVHERRRWYVDGDEDGVSVMANGADGKSETWHVTARIADLPAEVRPIVLDVRAALRCEDTLADKARARRREKRTAEFNADMHRRHPRWFNADGTRNADVMRADIAAQEKRDAEIDAQNESAVAALDARKTAAVLARFPTP